MELQLYSDEINFTLKLQKIHLSTHLWNYSIEFLNSAKQHKRTIAEFIEPLSRRPFKLKQGLIDFWIAIFSCLLNVMTMLCSAKVAIFLISLMKYSNSSLNILKIMKSKHLILKE